ncbi:hypothetical protein QBC35DRAFT_504859 [Podospora australis]|uniref:BTB domain-containing protein n=1 Tax=Podospora australis TaxID=1536484 RepID=A0AAN6WNM2_9PEZI|nr:hypothetical protein QBC35DRAFT_504859 [Podospora australis]
MPCLSILYCPLSFLSPASRIRREACIAAENLCSICSPRAKFDLVSSNLSFLARSSLNRVLCCFSAPRDTMSDSLEVLVVASPFASLAPLYEIDPEADTLLIVPPPPATFAPWESSSSPTTNGAVIASTKAAPPASRPGLRIKVSSKHLSLASRVFMNKIRFVSRKTATQSDGRIHLQLSPEANFDPKAVSIVLNAIHGRGGAKVPKQVDLDTLAQIALFVDKFQLFDALEVYGERWITKLLDDKRLPDTYNRELVLWVYISYVFRHPEVFKAVTKTMAGGSDGPLRTLGLPIREKLIKHIDAQRQAVVSSALTLVNQTLDQLTAGTASCNKYHCDSFLLGELVKSLTKNRLLWPRPEKPFIGTSFTTIVTAVEGTFQSQSRGLAAHRGGGSLWTSASENGINGVKEKLLPNGRAKGGNGIWEPITPEASPEPVARNGGGYFDTHQCDARKLVGKLDELDALEDGVKGLALEGSLGYRNY